MCLSFFVGASSAKADPRNLSLPVSTNLYAQYIANTFNNATKNWPDSSGNSRTITSYTGTPQQTTTAIGNGNTLTFPVVAGTTADGFILPFNLPTNYTLFTVARRLSSTGRIFDGTSGNWLSGFWSSTTGSAYHNGWLTPDNGTSGPLDNPFGTNWVVSTDQTSLYRANGLTRGTKTGSGTPIVSVNEGAYKSGEQSQWQIAEIIVYATTQLNSSDYTSVENYLMNKYGVTPYVDSSPVYTDFNSEQGNVYGDVHFGTSTIQMCPTGQVASGFTAYPGTGTAVSGVKLRCQSVSSLGMLSGGVTYTSTAFGSDTTGTLSEQSCAANSGLIGLKLWKGSSSGEGYPGGAAGSAFFIGGIQPICSPLPAATSTSAVTLSSVGSTTILYGTSQCATGAVVVGITGHYGSIDNSLGVICGYILGGTPFGPSGIAEVGNTLTDTSTYSARIPYIANKWETATVMAGPYVTISSNTTTSYSLTSGDKFEILRASRVLANATETNTTTASQYIFDSLSSAGGNIAMTFGNSATTTYNGIGGSGGYSYQISGQPSGVSINSATGLVSASGTTPRGTYTITVTVTDTLTATSSSSGTISVTTGVVSGSLALDGGVTTTVYRAPININATVTPAGKITFFAGGKAISGCKNMVFSGTKSCSWKPSQHGNVLLTASVTPTDASNYSSGSAGRLNVTVNSRSTKR